MRHFGPYIIVLGLLITAFGCGGGSGAGALSGGSDQTINMGLVSATYKGAGPMQPAVVSSNNGVVVTGIDSANYTQIILNPAKLLASTQIAFSEKDSIWLMGWNGANPRQVTPYGGIPAIDNTPNWFPGALGFIYVQSDPVSGYPQVFSSNADGTGTSVLTSLTPGCSAPAWSLGGSKFAFVHALGAKNLIFTANSNGSGAVQFSDGSGDCNYPVYSPDGTRVYFSYENSVASNYALVYVPASGGAQVTVVNIPAAFSPMAKPSL